MKRIKDRFTKKERCIHRHTIDEHPHCFASGLTALPAGPVAWYQEPGMKVGYLDIETDNLKADFGTTLTWCIKDKEGAIFSDVITKEELFSGSTDRRLIETLVEKLKEYKIIITYYGTGFDLPWIRAKALHYDLDFPGFITEIVETKTSKKVVVKPSLYHWDLYYVVKSKLNLSRKSLDNACDYLGIKGKTPIDKNVWRDAKYGDPVAVQKVLEHNQGDVIILEGLHNRLTAFSKWNRTPM